jgi:type I restriction enzyme, S subunit
MTNLLKNNVFNFVPLTDLVLIKYGGNISLKQLSELKKYPVFGANGIIGKHDSYTHKEPHVLISCRGAKSGTINISPPFSFITHNSLVLEKKNNNKLNTRFLSYALQFTDKSKIVTGSAQPQVTIDNLSGLQVPFTTIDNQQKIADFLDAQYERVSNGIGSIQETKLILNRFRQSILFAAVTGKLTESWRNIKGKEEWKIIPAEKVCGFITKGTTPKNLTIQSKGNIPFLKVYNIRNNKIDFEYNPSYVDRKTHEGLLRRSRVYPNDVLMNIVGPPLYKVAIVPNSYPEWNVNQAIAIFRPLSYILPRYLEFVLSCEPYVSQSLSLTRGVVGQSNISLQQTREIPIPLPTIDEQKIIIEKTNFYFGIADKIEIQIEKAETRISKLTQAILTKTFKYEG